jgi:hypothetical protein
MTNPDIRTGTDGETVFVALRQERGRYRDTEDATRLGGPQVQRALRNVLQRSCDRMAGHAEIQGRLYTTSLYVWPGDPTVAYAETDRDGVPVDAPHPALETPDAAGLNDYVDHLIDRCRISDALTPDTQVSLSTAFVPPRFEVVSAPEKQVLSWERIQDHARVVIVGEPGAGKTSCLRRLALDVVSRRTRGTSTLPVLIQLRDFPVADFTIAGITRLLAVDHLEESAAEFQDPLHAGRLLLLLDGLDELPTSDERRVFLSKLDDFCTMAPHVRVVMTSRDSTYNGELEDFTHVRIMPFDDIRITQWAILYLASHVTAPRHEFVDMLKYDSELRDLVRNPLLLGLAASLYWKYPRELNDRAGLLRKCIEVLIHDWDAARGVARWRQSAVSPRQIITLLAQMSALLIAERREEFTIDDVRRAVTEQAGFRESPVALLSACQTTGLVNDTGADGWQFTHRSFADYLAASHLVRRTEPVTDTFQTYFAAQPERGVWAMSCALASNAGDLLDTALQEQRLLEPMAAIMVAQALGHDITAPYEVIDRCCRFIVRSLEERLRTTRTLSLDTAAIHSHSTDRCVIWAAGAVLYPQDHGADDLESTARLLVLVHRARSGTASALLRIRMRASEVAVVRRYAEALDHDGWCESTNLVRGDQTVLCLAITLPPVDTEETPTVVDSTEEN